MNRQAEASAGGLAPPLPKLRSGVAGVLMGLANLVPGVSGGTMIVVMGLYDEFIGSIADVSRFRLTRRNVLFLSVVGGAAAVSIASFAGVMSRLVTLHQSAMFSLFIGMTLGGTPVLLRMIEGRVRCCAGGAMVGLLLMLAIVFTRGDSPDREALRQSVARGEFVVAPAYGLDVCAGILGVSAMVLPGISGAYMLLILGRYESIMASVSLAKDYVVSGGKSEAVTFLAVLIPVGLGVLIGGVALSNVLKWMLRAHRNTTIGILLGILCGSIVGIWPFSGSSAAADIGIGLLLACAGFFATLQLSRISA